MGTLKVNGNIEASTMLKLNGDWETDFGILFQEGGDSSYGAFIKYGLNDYLTIGTRNSNNDITAIKIYRGDNSVTVNGSVTASSFIGNLNGNATSASSVPWSGITGKPSLMPGTPGSIELFPGSSAGHGGFIDFHYNNSSSDYTARLINWNGKLQVDGATFNVGGKVELWTDGEGGNIRITSPNGSLWSIDALENSKLRFIWAEAQVPFSFQHDGVFNCAAIATSAWGPSLPGSGYWGQVFFKT